MKQIVIVYTDDEYARLMWLLKRRYKRTRSAVPLLKKAIDEIARQEAEKVVTETTGDGPKSGGQ